MGREEASAFPLVQLNGGCSSNATVAMEIVNHETITNPSAEPFHIFFPQMSAVENMASARNFLNASFASGAIFFRAFSATTFREYIFKSLNIDVPACSTTSYISVLRCVRCADFNWQRCVFAKEK